MSAIGRPVRFYADGDYDAPDRPEYDGFDGGFNMAGHDVWVTREVWLANMRADMERHDGPADLWDEARRYAINHAVETEHGILYPLVDCALHYVGESEG